MYKPQGTILTIDAAIAVIGMMRRGESITYYRGHIARDRVPDDLGEGVLRAQAVAGLADLMLRHGCPPNWTLGEGTVVNGFGTGALTQRRVGPGQWEYRFTKN